MLSACSSSGADSTVKSAPDPVIETRTVTREVCPAELALPLGERPQPGADAVVTGNEAGMAWLAAIMARVGLLEDRLTDAAKACP
mgnify:CR=1 FL=1